MTDLIPFQVWLESTLAGFTRVAAVMRSDWGWPVTESVHFMGLTLLFGSILAWDLRLIGLAKHIPVTAFHRLVPFAILGFATNAATGLLFLMTDPDQYVYNPAFHVKMLCVGLAGVNVGVFYLTMFGRVKLLGAGAQPPIPARVAGALSIALWMTVIVCGRLITVYRPWVCRPEDIIGFLAHCIVR
jgi:hypothetical protein